MRKLIFTFIIGLLVISLQSQTIVSTSPENKNVILEEFTGIHCGYCPDGHRLANLFAAAHPEDAFIINIHTGSYANPSGSEPDFRTEWGAAIAGQTGLTGYPAGTVNRHLFSGMSQGSGTAMSRGNFANAGNQILAQASYLNVACEASADFSVSPALLIVHVEAYYTGTDAPASNMLNVAVVQDSILGPQAGMSANPDYVVGDQYLHMHMLREMMTGQWGEEITETSMGSFIDRTYTWEIPGDINGVAIDPNHLRVIAFMAETTQEIISGNECDVTVIPPTSVDDAELTGISNIPEIACDWGVITPVISVLNRAGNPITSMEVEYSVNGGATHTSSWTGNIPFFQQGEVELDEISFFLEEENNLEINVVSVNGNDDTQPNDNSKSAIIYNAENVGVLALQIKTDNYGSETTWKIKNENGEVLHSGGPYTDVSQIVVDMEEFIMPENGCYTFEIYDAYGDGMDSGYGVGWYKLYNDGVLFAEGGDFGSEEITPFSWGTVSVEEVTANQEIQVYPNPSSGIFHVENAQGASMEIYNVNGQLIKKMDNATSFQTIDLSEVGNGTFLLRVQNQNTITTKVLVIQK